MIQSAPPQAKPRRPATENYYVSINDMMVGILFLFILLLTTYAVSFKSREDELNRLYKERVEQRSALITGLRGSLKLPPRDAALAEAQQGILRFDESTLFKSGDSALKPEGRALLNRLGAELTRKLPCYVKTPTNLGTVPTCPTSQAQHAILEAIYVEGHTDSTPYSLRGGSGRTNWELSSERAIAAYRAITGAGADGSPKRPLELLKNASGAENLIGISGYADRRKIDDARDGPNRRVDLRFVLAAPASDIAPPAAARP